MWKLAKNSNKLCVLQTKNMMVSCNARTKQASLAKYISILNIIQGEVDPTKVSKFAFQPFIISSK